MQACPVSLSAMAPFSTPDFERLVITGVMCSVNIVEHDLLFQGHRENVFVLTKILVDEQGSRTGVNHCGCANSLIDSTK